jgi:hypothetical protein
MIGWKLSLHLSFTSRAHLSQRKSQRREYQYHKAGKHTPQMTHRAFAWVSAFYLIRGNQNQKNNSKHNPIPLTKKEIPAIIV